MFSNISVVKEASERKRGKEKGLDFKMHLKES